MAGPGEILEVGRRERSGKPPGRSRRWVFAVLTILMPFLLLLLLEGGLRLAGYGQSHPLFIPVPAAPGFLRANPDVVRRFMVDERDTPNLWIRPVFFRRAKSPDTFRIFVQGESTTEGYPYGYGASPAGMLQQRLQRTFPQRKIEVVTTAMSAVNTYTLLDFSGEILEQHPDAVVIYAGHNEYVGILGVGSGFSVGRRRPVVLSFLWLEDARILQLGRRALSALRPAKPERQDRTLMATIVAEDRIPYGSPLYRRGLEQYRANLRALLRRYRKAGVPVFLGTVVSNERDQPPFLSGHGTGVDAAAWRRRFEAGRAALTAGDPGTALAAFSAAVALDDAHAAGHFGRGRALEQLGRYRAARQAYLAAKDRDELRFRAPEEINHILREVAAEQGAHVVEVQEAFHRAARHGIVGHDLMIEHLHPNLDGYFVLADAFYDALRDHALIGPWRTPVPPEQARREIPVTEVDRLYGQWRARYLTSDWPFTDRKRPFRLGRANGRVEEIAQSYYRGVYEWPDAMRLLLDHYCAVGDKPETARVAVLLAEAFPNRAEDQWAAAEALRAAGRPDSDVYRRRALAMGRSAGGQGPCRPESLRSSPRL
jgi:lysophospholipase L1-like esterase